MSEHRRTRGRSIRWARPFAVVAVAVLAAACSDEDPTSVEHEEEEVQPVGEASLGRVAFEAECAFCHASGDGLDLATFSFPDSTIVRRAVAHVDTPTALDIVAHIEQVRAEEVALDAFERDTRLFQPVGKILAGDVAFATELFGSDAWPLDWTTADLLAVDPMEVPAAVALPIWSVEESNVDWMPDDPLPDHILDAEGGLGRGLLAAYYAVPTMENLMRAAQTLRAVSQNRGDPSAPCITQEPERADYQTCFEIQRWISTFTAQHMLRNGLTGRVGPELHDVWWDVGQTVRRGILRGGVEFENGIQNWASWMYLGWIFEPERHASIYTAQGLANLGLLRHATFVALRSQVARPAGSFPPWADLLTAAQAAPEPWVLAVVRFGLVHLQERVDAGERPPDQLFQEAVARVVGAVTRTLPRVSEPERAELISLAEGLLTSLGVDLEGDRAF